MPDIQIGGLVSFTTIDYPGKLSCVLFLRGCPIRCAYCSNQHLITPGEGEYDADKVFNWLRDRVGKLEAVVFSGGEALMQGAATIDYIKRVRELGFKIGLHTNGFYPNLLADVSDYVDWIGLDYKAPRDKYESLVGNGTAYDLMSKSLDVWLKTGKDLEVRITCDPHFITKQDLLDIANDCASRGVHKIAIQKYIPHFESDENKTSDAARSQFFTDCDLRKTIDSMFESVTWRE
ncbi:MAG: anaerobic ribonucleoside-triphosphate reductase activating protein [Proteobacteria bacterium]|nr:anaerobic ribonucleoside-triphosphate reductase activating protein [Candidatus Enterousia scatequi]